MPASGRLGWSFQTPSPSADTQGQSWAPQRADLMFDVTWSVPLGIHCLSQSPWLSHKAPGNAYPEASATPRDTCVLVPGVCLEAGWPLGPHGIYFRGLAHLRLPAHNLGLVSSGRVLGAGLTRAAQRHSAVALFSTLEVPDLFRFNSDFAV